jgi:hypothetical protein
MDNIKYSVVDDNSPIQFSTPEKFPSKLQPDDTMEKITSEQFESRLREYVAKNKPRLMILTPCFGSVCFVSYTVCLISTIGLLNNYGIPVQIQFCRNDSLVSRARNNLIAKAMTNTSITHIMFIDNDISWEPVSILKLLLSDKHVIGGAYPLKSYGWTKLTKDPLNPYNTSNIIQQWMESKKSSQIVSVLSDEEYIQNKLLKYNINYLENTMKIENNLAKVKHMATGFMMIRRETIEKMFESFPSTKYVDDVSFLLPEENKYAYALFDCGVEEGHYFSEDWLFCDRWMKMGGEIYLDVTINLTHTGIEDYKGSYISSIL